jgi:ABC-type polysaccharide/polyol phosphate transport system ATPase subunit
MIPRTNSQDLTLACSEYAQRFAIEMRCVSKRFYIYRRQKSSLRELFVRTFRGGSQDSKPLKFSLEDVSISIGAGETWALIGPNGAGKSTLLRLMAGIYWPTEGQVIVRGHLAALIGLGVGFHPDLTGHENIFLYGNMLGVRDNELKKLYTHIVEFSGIQKFINTPVRYYSSGMRMRLGFSVATAVRPDVLLLDEILAVGDADFRNRCFERIRSFQNSGCTLVIATHDLGMAKAFASKSVWIDHGRIMLKGACTDVIRAYKDSFKNSKVN